MKLPKHIPQLDVLRGLAVLDVMVYHALDIVPRFPLRPLFSFGYVGVDLFFVLSGFLITGILINSKDSRGYFTNFYARRALRIWPLYYALLLFTFVLLPTIAPQLKAAIFEGTHPWQAFPFFLQNLTQSKPAFDTVRVTWSLAIEEQFYIVWPLIVWLAPRRALKGLALSGIVISIAVRWSVLYGLTAPLIIYTNTLTRLDGLSLGAFLALWIPEADSRFVKLSGIAVVALALPFAIAIGRRSNGHWAFYALVALCFAGMLCIAINMEALSNMKFMKYTGKISYALYLIHVPVFSLAGFAGAHKLLFPRSPIAAEAFLFLASFAICYALAAVSWHCFESKFLRMKDLFPQRPAQVSAIPSCYASTEK
jgi:peptidoglycan/LPS O-acetylase OafA/YrhL